MSDQFREQLKLYKEKKGIKTPSPKKKRHRKREKLSQNDIKELMGMDRPTFRRGKGGSMKQR